MKKFHAPALALAVLMCLGLFAACRKPVPGTWLPTSEPGSSSDISSSNTASSAAGSSDTSFSAAGSSDTSSSAAGSSDISSSDTSSSAAASSSGGSGSESSAPPDLSEPDPVRNTELYILMYHDFVEGDGADCNDWTLPIHRFREDLQWLSDHGYTAVLPSQLAAGEPLPERAVMITFDDGYESNYTLALPVLKEFNAGAVISLIVNHMDHQDPGWLTWDMCREMAETGLVEFGSHTYEFHAGQGILRRDGERRKAYEARVFPDIEKSISMIQSEVGNEVIFFAYPHGTTDKWASDFLEDHFSVTVTTKHGPADVSDGLYDMPRHNISLRGAPSQYLPA